MVNCSSLTFALVYLHVRAYQDDDVAYHLLSRPLQLNCMVDLEAEDMIWGLEGEELPPQEVFPLEPVTVFVCQEKMTSDAAKCLRFWAHQKLAEQNFFSMGIMSLHSIASKRLRGVRYTAPCSQSHAYSSSGLANRLWRLLARMKCRRATQRATIHTAPAIRQQSNVQPRPTLHGSRQG